VVCAARAPSIEPDEHAHHMIPMATWTAQRPVIWCNSTFFRCNNSASRAVVIPGRLPVEAAQCDGVLRVLSDWAHVACTTGDSASSHSHTRAVNALTQKAVAHAEIFAAFTPARVPPAARQEAVNSGQVNLVDFMGTRYPAHLFCNAAYIAQHNEDAHAIRTRQCQFFRKMRWLSQNGKVALPGVQMTWPVVAEEYFEYMDVLASVLDFAPGTPPATPRRPYTFVELGSGYGHWTFAAHRALQQRAPNAPHHYLLVDVVASLQQAVVELARLNNVSTAGSNHSLHFHVGFVSEKNRSEQLSGDDLLRASRQSKMYSQLWGTGHGDRHAWQAAISQPATLEELFEQYQTPRCIDMVDIDIQNNEYVWTPGDGGGLAGGRPGLFANDRSITTLTRRAKRVHIGLHASGAYDEPLIEKFRAAGWTVRWYFPMTHFSGQWSGERSPTPFGPVMFNDGVLSLINTNWPCDASAER